MDNQDQNTPIMSKIEIEEGTTEPKIVEVPIEDVPDTAFLTPEDVEKDTAIKIDEDSGLPIVTKENRKSVGKQLAMTRVLGYNQDDASISKRQRLFKNICTIVFAVFVLAVLAFTFYNDFFASPDANKKNFSFSALLDVLGSCWYYLIFALMALLFCFFFKGLKLSIMCKSMTGKWHFKTCQETGVIGLYYNNVTPLAVGGQPFEIYHLSHHGVHGGVASSLPIATFFLNQFAFVILGIISLLLFKHNALGLTPTFLDAFSPYASVFTVLAIIGLTLGFATPFMVVCFSMFPKIGASLVHFVMMLGGKLRIIKKPKETTFRTIKTVVNNSKCLKKIATNPLVFISTFLLSFVEQLSMSSIAYFTLKFFGFDIIGVGGFREWAQIIHLCLILYAAISFIPTPGNSGAADLSFYLLFETGLMAGLAFPSMMVWRFLSFYSFILIGFIFVTVKKKREKKHPFVEK